MNYSRFDHVDSDEEEPDTAAAAAGERRKLEAAADSIPGPLRMALGRMHIALDRGDEAAATDARNSMGVLINQLPESERPKVMAAIQSVVVGGAKVRPSGARLDASSRSVAKEEKAIQKPSPAVQKPTPAVQKPTPAVQALAPTVQALAPTVQKPAPVEDAGTSSREEARDELTRAASTLEAAQKELQALDPSDTRGLLNWVYKMGVSPADIEAASKSDEPRKALEQLAEGVFKARHEAITKQAMTIPGAVETTPSAAAAIMALQKERETVAKSVEEAAPTRRAEVAAKRAEVMAREAAAKREQEASSMEPSEEDMGKHAVSAAQAAHVAHEAAALPPPIIEEPDASASDGRFELSEVDGAILLLVRLPESVTSMGQLGVDIGSELVEVSVDGECYAHVPMVRGIDDDTATAKFDKKRKLLRIGAAFA